MPVAAGQGETRPVRRAGRSSSGPTGEGLAMIARRRVDPNSRSYTASCNAPAALTAQSRPVHRPRSAHGIRMSDNLSARARSHAMRQVRSRDTSPERAVRKLLLALGRGGYRLHRDDVPGRPDVAWIGRRQALFVHGCFWHGHRCKRGRRAPATNVAYWRAKIARNRRRDALARVRLRRLGWSVVTVWECELRDPARLERRLRAQLGSSRKSGGVRG